MDTNISYDTGISYKGKVNLKLKVGNKIIELNKNNTATTDMFIGICKYLTGNLTGNTGSADIPKYIDLRRKKTDEDSWETAINRTVSISAANYSSTDTSGIASYTGTISYISLINGAISSDYSYRLYLMSGYDTSYKIKDLAYIDLAFSDLSNFTSGTILIIEWIITISQK